MRYEDIPERLRPMWHKAAKSRKWAIRLNCLVCTCFQESEVRKCDIEACPCWPWRMGRPTPRGVPSVEPHVTDASGDDLPLGGGFVPPKADR